MSATGVVAGVDEVGRGCLAGPVVTAAVVLPEIVYDWISEIKDSKKLSHKKRTELAALITKHCKWAIEEGSPSEIEEFNILGATLRCMGRSVENLLNRTRIDLVLVDGNQTIPNLNIPQEAIKNGDNLYKCIGAASIIAKVYRDNYMWGMHQTYPQYCWDKNKGYGTEAHREAIMEYGITHLHRKTFRGVAEYA